MDIIDILRNIQLLERLYPEKLANVNAMRLGSLGNRVEQSNNEIVTSGGRNSIFWHLKVCPTF